MKRLNLNTDKNLTENSNILASSQQALKYYIDQKRVLLNYLQANEPTSFSIGEKWLNTSSNKIFTALSSSTWDSGTDLESGQIYSFNNLLYHWNGENLLIYSSGSVTETHNNTEVKTWVGTQSEYDAIVTKDPTTEYSITDAYSNLDIILATQTEFNNSSTTKAATPYQVNQKMGNYLPLAGGNLNAGAILRLTNANNEVTPLAFDTSGYLTVGSKLYVSTETNTNSLIVRSGNVYKSDLSGATIVWSDSYATTSKAGAVQPDGNTITVDSNGVITAIGGGSSVLWGAISGTLSDQTDLQSALNAKQATISDLATIRSGASAGATAVQPSDLSQVECIVETYNNGTSWYRVYSDGWCEQGGYTSAGVEVQFLKQFKDTNYTVIGIPNGGTSSSSATTIACYNKTITGVFFTTASNSTPVNWKAEGYII